MHSTVVQERKNLFGPHCPYCHEPIMANHLYCRSCGASQIVPEFDRSFCPFCGLRVSKRQEFCHECCGHLMLEETPDQELKRPSFLQRFSVDFVGWATRSRKAFLVMGGVLFAVVIYLALSKAAIIPFGSGPSPEKSPRQGIVVAKETGPSQSVTKKSPAASQLPAAEPPAAQVTAMLSRIRQAQLNKDINLFLSSFSPSFLQLEEKRQQVLKTWQVYDFVDLNYKIQDIQQQDNNTVAVKVYWQGEFKNQNTEEIKQLDKYYSVSFSKEGGQWLIKDM